MELACVRCGCTEERACEGGCSWVEITKDGALCSACVPSIVSILKAADVFDAAASDALKSCVDLDREDAAPEHVALFGTAAREHAHAASTLRALAAIAARLGPVQQPSVVEWFGGLPVVQVPERATRANRSSGIRGVTRDDRSRSLAKPWRGKVRVNGRTYQTPRFATPEEAGRALDALRDRVQEFPS